MHQHRQALLPTTSPTVTDDSSHPIHHLPHYQRLKHLPPPLHRSDSPAERNIDTKFSNVYLATSSLLKSLQKHAVRTYCSTHTSKRAKDRRRQCYFFLQVHAELLSNSIQSLYFPIPPSLCSPSLPSLSLSLHVIRRSTPLFQHTLLRTGLSPGWISIFISI
jgi:hypothetical protein